MIDLDDTSNCPLGWRCESCGAANAGNSVATATTPLGVLCLTLCAACAHSSVAPPIGVGTAVRLVEQHAGHLGITADEMTAALTARD